MFRHPVKISSGFRLIKVGMPPRTAVSLSWYVVVYLVLSPHAWLETVLSSCENIQRFHHQHHLKQRCLACRLSCRPTILPFLLPLTWLSARVQVIWVLFDMHCKKYWYMCKTYKFYISGMFRIVWCQHFILLFGCFIPLFQRQMQ